MQIFCDESGGKGEDHFLAVAVRGEAGGFDLVIRRFRKKAGWKHQEVKGNLMSPADMKQFVDILLKHGSGCAMSVVCSREAPIGGYAMSLEESVVWTSLIAESVLPLMDAGVTRVVPDGGRYSKLVLDAAETEIAARVAGHTDRKISVSCGKSEQHHGIQVADVLANLIMRSLTTKPDTEQAVGLVAMLVRANTLQVQSITLEGRRPAWLDDYVVTALETPKAAQGAASSMVQGVPPVSRPSH